MTGGVSAGAQGTDVAFGPRRSRWRQVRVLAARNPLGTLGLMVVIAFVVIAIAGPSLVADPARLSGPQLAGPSADHWFGTDNLGRDYFARVVVGARSSIILALTAAAIGIGSALVVGTLSSYLGGIVDLVVQRFVDMLLAFPGLILLLLIVQVMGRETMSIAVGLGLLYASGLSRIVRSYMLSAMAQPYVESARVIGASHLRIVLLYLLPNLIGPLLIYSSAVVSSAILAEGALAFIGLGIRPPAPSWGRMLAEARTQWQAPYISFFPGAAITLSVLGFSLLGDSLRDELDPRLRNH